MFKFKHKVKYKEPKPELKTLSELINTLEIMKNCGVREMAFNWKDIILKRVKKRTLLKVCRMKYGKVCRKWNGFSIRFNV